MKYHVLSAVVFALGCGSGSTPDPANPGTGPDATTGEILDSGLDAFVEEPVVPVLGTGTILSDATVLTAPVLVEYFTTDAGVTYAYYPDASNALCPIPTTYLCVNNFFALCLNDVYSSTIDPCNFNADGSIEVWTPNAP
jgi:hypothetical protein